MVDDAEHPLVGDDRVLPAGELVQADGGPGHEVLHGLQQQPGLEPVGLQHLAQHLRDTGAGAQRVDLLPGLGDAGQLLRQVLGLTGRGRPGRGQHGLQARHRVRLGRADRCGGALPQHSQCRGVFLSSSVGRGPQRCQPLALFVGRAGGPLHHLPPGFGQACTWLRRAERGHLVARVAEVLAGLLVSPTAVLHFGPSLAQRSVRLLRCLPGSRQLLGQSRGRLVLGLQLGGRRHVHQRLLAGFQGDAPRLEDRLRRGQRLPGVRFAGRRCLGGLAALQLGQRGLGVALGGSGGVDRRRPLVELVQPG